MKIIIASDAYTPSINGVVRTLISTVAELEKLGHKVLVIEPRMFLSFGMPGYREIRLSLVINLMKMVKEFCPDAIHISVEGPIGLAMRNICKRQKWRYTTAYHTDFPSYVERNYGISNKLAYWYLRWFHKYSSSVMVSTQSVRDILKENGFKNISSWGRGVDTELFYPREENKIFCTDKLYHERPILLNVGRISSEKNLDAFLSLDIPGTKIVVGDGPDRELLEKKYPNTVFYHSKSGERLAEFYSQADVFVFPSKTDTFGLVIIEAMASGTPVAAFPVTGPRDVIKTGGCCDSDLTKAITTALAISSDSAIENSALHTWKAATEEFLRNLVDIRGRS
jgi:glycosyltransferase involved in cell wall biosynthesis